MLPEIFKLFGKLSKGRMREGLILKPRLPKSNNSAIFNT